MFITGLQLVRRAWLLALATFMLLSASPVVYAGSDAGSDKLKKKALRRVDEHLQYGETDFALEYLNALLQAYPEDVDIHYRMGLCFLANPNKQINALRHFKFIENSGEVKTEFELDLYLGKSYQMIEQFDSAAYYYRKFTQALDPSLNGNDELIKDMNVLIANCQVLKKIQESDEMARVMGAGEMVNTAFPEYAPVISPDGKYLLFASRRLGFAVEDPTYNSDLESIESIYICEKDTSGEWMRPENQSMKNGFRYHEAPLCFLGDGSKLLIYRAKDNEGGDIYLADFSEGTISNYSALNKEVNTKYNEPSAFVTIDGKNIYFSSDRPGGYGGLDLYVGDIDEKGNVSNVRNLGKNVNSPADEDSPFLIADGQTLFFCSNGHNTLGGYDIFKAYKSGDDYSLPQNLGYPVNTAGDDAHMYWNTDHTKAYFSSYRKASVGGKDIFVLDRGNTELKLMAYDKNQFEANRERKPLLADIRIVDRETGDTVGSYQTNPNTGSVFVSLAYERDYDVFSNSEGYMQFFDRVRLPNPATFDESKAPQVSKDIAMVADLTYDPNTAIAAAPKSEKSELIENEEPNAEYIAIQDKSETPKRNVTAAVPDEETYAYLNADEQPTRKANNVQRNTLKPALTEDVVEIEVVNGTKITMPAARMQYVEKNYTTSEILYPKVHFLFDNYDHLTEYSRQWLNTVVAILTEHPDMKIRIMGHADLVGNYGYNDQLSRKRAETVAKYLVAHGIDGNRLKKEAYGKTKPVVNTKVPCLANRRVEFETNFDRVSLAHR